MRNISLDREWSFDFGPRNFSGPADTPTRKTVNLPHDYMIEGDVFEQAPEGAASGFYDAGVAHYLKKVAIPAEWENELVYLWLDGAMMNATVEINGSKAALQHYGYAPFCVELTPFLYFGAENSIAVTLHPGTHPNSRWYSGAGLFRSVTLVHTPKLHIKKDGVYVWTRALDYAPDGSAETAYLNAEIDLENRTAKNALAEVSLSLIPEGESAPVITRKTRVQVNAGASETAYLLLTLDEPLLWDAEHPRLYRAAATVTYQGEFRTHPVPAAPEEVTADTAEVLFGVREIRADVKHGLRINGKSVKLRGGCLHHDNGPLGAVSLYDAEARKVRILKSIGFNAIRTTHNPPSAALIEACDRLGVYVFDEAFDAWGMGKRPGDYNLFFETDWDKDLTAFVRRDRSHPSVIIWSTGNEITERGGLGDGYAWSTKLARRIRALDCSRPISNGICSFWNGLDDELMAEFLRRAREKREGLQNADVSQEGDTFWEEMTEPYTNGMDIVGYNYLEDNYAQDHELFPDRVIMGSENFPNLIGVHWPMIEAKPWLVGDFTWTAWDYIGEAGIGKGAFFAPDDPRLEKGPQAIGRSLYPWRTADDADVDICGTILPQGVYRRIVWGSGETAVFSYDPAVTGMTEILSRWGFTDARPCWNWQGQEGKPVRLAVFSAAEEAEVLINGVSLGRKKAGEALAADMPFTFAFDGVYEPGTVEAIGYIGGKEVSRSSISTVGKAAAIRLTAERECVSADGHGLIYVGVEVTDENGCLVPDADHALTAALEGEGLTLAAFGSGNPITEENYTRGSFRAYRGRALAILRAGYVPGEAKLTVSAEGFAPASLTLCAK